MNEFELVEFSRHLRKIASINEHISEHLLGSVLYLLKYSEKYKVKLPKKEELENIIFNLKPLLESHNEAIQKLEQSKKFSEIKIEKNFPDPDITQLKKSPDDYPESKNVMLKYHI